MMGTTMHNIVCHISHLSNLHSYQKGDVQYYMWNTNLFDVFIHENSRAHTVEPLLFNTSRTWP